MPCEIASSAEIFPVPDMRSTKMRLRVSSVSDSLSTRRVSLNAFAHASANPVGKIALHSADATVGHRETRAGHHLHQVPQVLAGLDHVEEHRERAQLHGAGANAREVIRNPGDLRHDHADVVAAVRDRHPQQLLHGHAVAHVVDERRDVVEAVGVGHDAVVVDRLGHLLEAAMQVANLDIDVDDPLPVERRDDPDDPVHRGMRRPDIQQHLARLHQFTGPMSGCRLSTG